MSSSPESIVRDFLQVGEPGDLKKVLELLSEDAVFTHGGRGVHSGFAAIRASLTEMGGTALTVVRNAKMEIATDRVVTLERLDSFTLGDKTILYEIAVAFDIDRARRIKRRHEYDDRQPIIDQISADNPPAPGTEGRLVKSPERLQTRRIRRPAVRSSSLRRFAPGRGGNSRPNSLVSAMSGRL